MHPRGVKRFLESNYEFSPCSIANISSALTALGKFQRNCLKDGKYKWNHDFDYKYQITMLDDFAIIFNVFSYEVPQHVCGNGILEAWEECDCGEDYEDCALDNCCYPGNHPSAPCSLKPSSQCR